MQCILGPDSIFPGGAIALARCRRGVKRHASVRSTLSSQRFVAMLLQEKKEVFATAWLYVYCVPDTVCS